jgi:DNA-directed RNA polymerase subunit omega
LQKEKAMSRYREVYELAAEVGGMYALVVATARRAKQLREGRQPVVESTSGNPLTISIQEFLEGRVVVRPPGAADEEPTAETEVVEVAAPEAPEDAEAADEDEAGEE